MPRPGVVHITLWRGQRRRLLGPCAARWHPPLEHSPPLTRHSWPRSMYYGELFLQVCVLMRLQVELSKKHKLAKGACMVAGKHNIMSSHSGKGGEKLPVRLIALDAMRVV